ncbi:MAG: PKD domain-containing protein [Nitrospirota bacterium]
MAACVVFSAPSAFAFKILEPAEKAVLKAGQPVTVNVDVGRDPGIVSVKYFWYHEMDETLVEQEEAKGTGQAKEGKLAAEKYWQKDFVYGSNVVAIASLVATADGKPPFGGPLMVPKPAIGTVRLLAVAEISRGRLGTRTVFDEVLVKVDPGADLTAIEFETEKPLRLGRAGQASAYGQVDSLGKTFELPVVGVFADGVERPISPPSTGTAYQSSNDKVIRVLPEGLLQIAGNGRTTLTVTNRGKQASLDVIVEVNDEPNEPPTADAGPSRTVKAGTKVKLSGLKSRDPEGEALYYSWSQVRGSKVALLDVNMPEASFLAPQVSEKRLYRFKLRVTDKKGADSPPAYVDVTVEP